MTEEEHFCQIADTLMGSTQTSLCVTDCVFEEQQILV